MIEKLQAIQRAVADAQRSLEEVQASLAALIHDGAVPVEPAPPPPGNFPFDILPKMGTVGPATFVNVSLLLRGAWIAAGVGMQDTWSRALPAGQGPTMIIPVARCEVGRMPHAAMFQNAQFWAPGSGDLCVFTAWRQDGAWYLTFSEGNHPGDVKFGTPGWRGDGFLTPAMAYEWGAAIGQPKPLRRGVRFPASDKSGPVPWVTFAASHKYGRSVTWGLAGLGEGLA